jgi:hypothetical protein
VTWGIIEGHEGSIAVDSEPEKGTRFTVRLPYRVPEATAQESGAAAVSARPRMPAAQGVGNPSPTGTLSPRSRPESGAPFAPPEPLPGAPAPGAGGAA